MANITPRVKPPGDSKHESSVAVDRIVPYVRKRPESAVSQGRGVSSTPSPPTCLSARSFSLNSKNNCSFISLVNLIFFVFGVDGAGDGSRDAPSIKSSTSSPELSNASKNSLSSEERFLNFPEEGGDIYGPHMRVSTFHRTISLLRLSSFHHAKDLQRTIRHLADTRCRRMHKLERISKL
eukprot:jgi/Botrbrau1/12863/Bobra.0188s0006.1